MLAANTGGAIEAYGAFWGKYDGGSDAYLPATAAAARSLAEACRQYAGAVRDAKHRVEELAVEVGATLVAGAVWRSLRSGPPRRRRPASRPN